MLKSYKVNFFYKKTEGHLRKNPQHLVQQQQQGGDQRVRQGKFVGQQPQQPQILVQVLTVRLLLRIVVLITKSILQPAETISDRAEEISLAHHGLNVGGPRDIQDRQPTCSYLDPDIWKKINVI